jgi:hypothetical protein
MLLGAIDNVKPGWTEEVTPEKKITIKGRSRPHDHFTGLVALSEGKEIGDRFWLYRPPSGSWTVCPTSCFAVGYLSTGDVADNRTH